MALEPWFELSNEGWRVRSSRRPLGRLLLEAVQNAFDVQAPLVEVELHSDHVLVEDTASVGLVDERFAYTVYLTDKHDRPTRRGRLGRGLKELIAAMDEAVVHTVGTTLVFDARGRRSFSNERVRGTRIELRRGFEPDELEQAASLLRLCVTPPRVELRVNGEPCGRPRRAFALPSCELDTIRIEAGIEQTTRNAAVVSLYTPRPGETPHLFEMGIPVEPWDVPWHGDVAQRIPLSENRDHVPERFKLALKATLLEAMMPRYLDAADLRADWVLDVVAKWRLKPAVLDMYVSKVFPRGAVLEGTRHANDRARQLGAHVVEAQAMSYGAYVTLGRVLETADDYVRRRAAELEGRSVEPDEAQRRFADAVRWLARRLAGVSVRVCFFERDPTDDGLLEDAVTDARVGEIAFNVRGPLRFDDVLEPYTFGIVLHELAHFETQEHDRRFVDRLQQLAGRAVHLLAEGGTPLADALRGGDPDR